MRGLGFLGILVSRRCSAIVHTYTPVKSGSGHVAVATLVDLITQRDDDSAGGECGCNIGVTIDQYEENRGEAAERRNDMLVGILKIVLRKIRGGTENTT